MLTLRFVASGFQEEREPRFGKEPEVALMEVIETGRLLCLKMARVTGVLIGTVWDDPSDPHEMCSRWPP